MGWLNKEPAKLQEVSEKKSIPSGVWEKCSACGEVILASDLIENHLVCTNCGHHSRLPGAERVELLIDRETFFEWDHNIASLDPLHFDDGRKYEARLGSLWKNTRRYDAIITGAGLMHGMPVALGVLDFFWMGGSMGTVVGERILRLFSRARFHDLPVIMVSSSGGARMHEGLLSLMQMAKTCSAVAKHREAGYAMLGDINLAEPKSTIGFAGRRVIENTIRQKLPEDFQTAEFLLNHGMVDAIVRRHELKDAILRILKILMGDSSLKNAVH
jgi:acetyl-CoA carboxylase carboxyl transferase subunit beta